MTDTITIPQLKQLIWKEANQNLQYINAAKTNINWDHAQTDHAPYIWYKLFVEVKRLRSERLVTPAVVPMRRQYPAKYKAERITPEAHTATEIPVGTNEYDKKSMQQRYQQAHLRWSQQETPNVVKDGFYLPPKYPAIHTSNGITDLVMNYLKWMGHFSNRTNNIGRSRAKVAPRFSLATGKIEQIVTGTIYIKSTSKKGMQDIDANLKHPSHSYGIPWKIEVKCRATRDTQKDEQIAYAAKVEATGAVYSLVRDDVDFFSQYDGLMHQK